MIDLAPADRPMFPAGPTAEELGGVMGADGSERADGNLDKVDHVVVMMLETDPSITCSGTCP